MFNDGIRREEEFISHNETFATKQECDNYIHNYYYDGQCENCKYQNAFTDWKCRDCAYLIETDEDTLNTDKSHGNYYCRLLSEQNIIVNVYNRYHTNKAEEICKYYKPTLQQNVRDYISWEVNEDILKNCDFNPNCPLHKNSCHKTCTYEHYLNRRMEIPISFEYNGRKVKKVQIYRYQWINQSFIKDNEIECLSLYFEYELNGHGKPRKEDLPIYQAFNNLTKIKIN